MVPLPRRIRLKKIQCICRSATPERFLSPVWPLSGSLATTTDISVDFFSSPYLDVSVQAVPLVYLWIQYTMYGLAPYGLLHSEICGSKLAYSSPQLIAVNHVLHRLPMPRHSPCAYIRFTICEFPLRDHYEFCYIVIFTRLFPKHRLLRSMSFEKVISYFT